MSASPPICVIGVSGFVGSHVAAELLDQGHAVHGTLREPEGPKGAWLRERLGSRGELTLTAAEVGDRDRLAAAMAGTEGVVMCAGVEAQEPRTVQVMLSAAENTLRAAHQHGITRAVFTSSTGSTNPPDGEPAIKREDEHVSDAGQQIAVGKYSPAAKTLMEHRALHLGAELGIRVSTLNPSLIVGCGISEQPSPAERWFGAILRGERMADRAPNGSMSMIHVQDLARLHVAALQREEARGRYFGVVQSWHWQDILEALDRAVPAYRAPAWPEEETRTFPTRFDTRRRDSLGVPLRGLDAMLQDLVAGMRQRGTLPV
mgnify:CR=1 FL=1